MQDYDPFSEGQAADIMPGTLEAPHIPSYDGIKHLKKYLRPERLYPEGMLMSNGQKIKKNAHGVIEPTVLRPMYPKWKYHATHEDRVVSSPADEASLPGNPEDWSETPVKPINHRNMPGKSVTVTPQNGTPHPASGGSNLTPNDLAAIIGTVMATLRTENGGNKTPASDADYLAYLAKKEAEKKNPEVESAARAAVVTVETSAAPSEADQKSRLMAAAEARGIKTDKRWSLDRLMRELNTAIDGQ